MFSLCLDAILSIMYQCRLVLMGDIGRKNIKSMQRSSTLSTDIENVHCVTIPVPSSSLVNTPATSSWPRHKVKTVATET